MQISTIRARSIPQPERTFVFVLLAVLIITGVLAVDYRNVDSYDPHQSQQSDSERLKGIKRLIDNEIGVPHANELSQCHLIGFGSKPCGGPWTYLVYSTVQTNEFKLEQLVTDYNQVQRKFNIERKTMSDCMLARKPKIESNNGVCTAVDEVKQKWEKWRQQK
jgi:hypothetical protein